MEKLKEVCQTIGLIVEEHENAYSIKDGKYFVYSNKKDNLGIDVGIAWALLYKKTYQPA